MPMPPSISLRIPALILSSWAFLRFNEGMRMLPFLSFLFLLACGGGDSGKNAAVMETELDVATILQSQEFGCAPLSGSVCPEGIGRVFIQSAQRSGEFILCTGFLVGEDLLATNGHCLREEEECPRTFVTFPNGKNARCSTIVRTYYDEEDFFNGRDLTLIRLDQNLGIRPIDIDRESVQRNEEYSVWVMDHFSIMTARLTEFECRYEGPGLTQEFSNCPVIQGNSGSPVLNNRGEAVSIIWGSNLTRDAGPGIPLSTRRDLEAMAFGTELQILLTILE